MAVLSWCFCRHFIFIAAEGRNHNETEENDAGVRTDASASGKEKKAEKMVWHELTPVEKMGIRKAVKKLCANYDRKERESQQEMYPEHMTAEEYAACQEDADSSIDPEEPEDMEEEEVQLL